MHKLPENFKYRRKAVILMAAILFVLHLMYIPFMLIYGYIEGDIAYSGIIGFLGVTLTVISVLTKYFLYGVLLTVYEHYSSRQSMPFTVVASASLLITRIAEIISYSVTNAPVSQDEAKSFIYTTLISFAIDVAVLLILFFAAKSLTPRKLSVFTVLALIVCAVPLITDLLNEFLTFRVIMNDYSYSNTTMTGAEVLAAVWGFAQHFVKAFAGFFILFFVNSAMTRSQKTKTKKDN
ncbi:MAG: hypothetical protein E7652_01415 [Ruminococcaceae bacterium]|nr:hypothetical protein [Oscillospiraceae bacterium]